MGNGERGKREKGRKGEGERGKGRRKGEGRTKLAKEMGKSKKIASGIRFVKDRLLFYLFKIIDS